MPTTRMKKRLLILSLPLDEWLVKEAKRLGLSVSEVIRRALDRERFRDDNSTRMVLDKARRLARS